MNWKWGRQDPPRHPAPVPRPRGWPRRGCVGPCSPDRHADLQEHRFHPGQPAVPPDRSRRAHSGHRSRQPARPCPLRRTTMLVHPTLDLLASLGLHGMAKAFQDLEAQPEGQGAAAYRMARSVARSGGDGASAKALRGARPGCPSAPLGQHRGRRLPRRPRARSRPLPQARSARAGRPDAHRLSACAMPASESTAASTGLPRPSAITGDNKSGGSAGCDESAADGSWETEAAPKYLFVLTPRLSGASGREMALANMLKRLDLRSGSNLGPHDRDSAGSDRRSSRSCWPRSTRR